MVEKIALRIFWGAMLLCAPVAIVGVWLEDTLPEQYFKLIPTLFIIGLAAFLIWAPIFAYRFREKLVSHIKE